VNRRDQFDAWFLHKQITSYDTFPIGLASALEWAARKEEGNIGTEGSVTVVNPCVTGDVERDQP
jgi:hypothetical protein